MILLAEPDSSIEVSEPPKESNSVFTRIVNWVKKRTSVEKEVHSASAAAVDGVWPFRPWFTINITHSACSSLTTAKCMEIVMIFIVNHG